VTVLEKPLMVTRECTAHGANQPRLTTIRHNTAITTTAATVARAICRLQRVVCSGFSSCTSLDLAIFGSLHFPLEIFQYEPDFPPLRDPDYVLTRKRDVARAKRGRVALHPEQQ